MLTTYRKYFTAAVALTFVVVGGTGILFQFFFKTHTLEDIHGWLGVAMVAAAIVHIIQNWKSLANHFRNWRVAALAIPVILLIVFFSMEGQEGSGGAMSPGKVFQKLSQASARDVAKVFGKDPDSVLADITRDGLQAGTPDETVMQLAQRNHQAPNRILVYFTK